MKELLIVSLAGIAVLAADVIKFRKAVLPIAVASLFSLIFFCIVDWGRNENPMDNNMLLFDNFALGFTAILTFISLCWFLITTEYFGNDARRTDLYALTLFSICGAVLMVSYTNLVMLFLGIEILSIPLYVLAASKKGDRLSNEAGFKYFFLGSLASAILLFGIAMVYGATGSFDLGIISTASTAMSSPTPLLNAGIVMIFAGFAFKVSAAPFHFWAPDVYQGSPTPVTAFMATVVKGAAFAAMFRLFSGTFGSFIETYGDVIAIISALTLIIANIVAAVQTNVKRLLAYSSISHAGFMLGAILSAQNGDPKILLYYILTYGIASLTSFIVLYHVSAYQQGAEDFNAFKGLVKRNPVLAGAMTLAVLSMAGIPPLSGFLAKYFVISSVLQSGYLWLVIIMILTSVVGAYYYLRIIIAMFTPLENSGRIVVSDFQKYLFLLLSLLMVGLFFAAAIPDWLY
ncbi:MAG: NADH-quinone oxidoreductase subunit N [Crocinitomicaceae bacterium]|nr:NADH-quinone oxidoreductase subunit N [Crocinitomicaceae bacterium]